MPLFPGSSPSSALLPSLIASAKSSLSRLSLLVSASVVLTGCVTGTRMHVSNYPNIMSNLTVVEANQEYVTHECRKEIAIWDDGSEVQDHEDFAGCFIGKRNIIYIVEGSKPCIWKHELCHASGYPLETCDKVECD